MSTSEKSSLTTDYLNPTVLQKISGLEVRARHLVEGFLTGQHKSPFHGFAVEFASHREYVPGDEIKHIDWKVWSKTDRLYIKEHEEETNLRCTIVLDCSLSMQYGQPTAGGAATEASPRQFNKQIQPEEYKNATFGLGKFDYAATLSAGLAYLMRHQQDAFSLTMFDHKIRSQMPHASHTPHLRELVHELEEAKLEDTTDFDGIFEALSESIGSKGLVVLISDFFTSIDTYEKCIRSIRRKGHELILMQVLHEDEATFPFDQNTKFMGMELDAQLLTDPRALRKSYMDQLNAFNGQLKRIAGRHGSEFVSCHTGQPLGQFLSRYLAAREKAATRRSRGR